MTTDDVVLDMREVSVDYGWGANAVHAINSVSLHVRRSRVLGIAGESGSGKSTLVYAATRLLRSPGVVVGGQALLSYDDDGDSGSRTTIDLFEATAKQLRELRWNKVSIVLQSALSALNPVYRIGHEFDEVLSTHRRSMGRSERRARAEELLGLVGLAGDRLDRFPHELSGGQRQRVMIALALALDPALVIMDEPTTALDVVTQHEIVKELAALRERFGFAMIFITHDLSLLVELADDIAVMYSGHVVERAPARELYTAPRHPYSYGLLNSSPPLTGDRVELSGIPGTPPDLSLPLVGCPFAGRCAYVMDRCTAAAPPLRTLDEGGREVACWLHDDPSSVPVELRASADLVEGVMS